MSHVTMQTAPLSNFAYGYVGNASPMSYMPGGGVEVPPYSDFGLTSLAYSSFGNAVMGETIRAVIGEEALLANGTTLDGIINWTEAGGAIGVSLSGQVGLTSLIGLGGSGQGGVQILYQPISGEFGLFGYGGGAGHASIPMMPVLGWTVGGLYTSPMSGLDEYGGGFLGHSGTIGPFTLAHDRGVSGGVLTDVEAKLAGMGAGTPFHVNLIEYTYYVGWTSQHGFSGF